MTDPRPSTSASSACQCDFAVLAKGLEIHTRTCPTIAAARIGKDHLANHNAPITVFVSDAEDAESIDLLVAEANERKSTTP